MCNKHQNSDSPFSGDNVIITPYDYFVRSNGFALLLQTETSTVNIYHPSFLWCSSNIFLTPLVLTYEGHQC